MVDRLADQQNCASIFARLTPQQVNRKLKAIENSGSAVPRAERTNRAPHQIDVQSKILKQLRSAVKTYQSNPVRDIAHNCLDQRSKVTILIELASPSATRLNVYDQG
jgi:hypothetical protein